MSEIDITWVLEMIRDRDCKTEAERDCMNEAIAKMKEPSVVRCKDCKYRKSLPNVSYGECIYASHMVSNDDYCSYGERKEK